MQLKKFRGRAAFTLVEIMIVVAIIGLLAAIAVPNLLRAREKTQLSLIQNNLRLIDNAKQSWALENNQPSSATPTSEQLAPYFNKSKFPDGSVGETYNIGTEVHLHLTGGTQTTVLRIDDALRVTPSAALYGDLKALLGANCLS
jgi:prepilin-type N-terminal cleavage/methylation domain-containing protein